MRRETDFQVRTSGIARYAGERQCSRGIALARKRCQGQQTGAWGKEYKACMKLEGQVFIGKGCVSESKLKKGHSEWWLHHKKTGGAQSLAHRYFTKIISRWSGSHLGPRTEDLVENELPRPPSLGRNCICIITVVS